MEQETLRAVSSETVSSGRMKREQKTRQMRVEQTRLRWHRFGYFFYLFLLDTKALDTPRSWKIESYAE